MIENSKLSPRRRVNFRKELYSLYKFSWLESVFLFLRSFVLDYIDITRHLPAKAKILDVGCGYGILANYLALSEPVSDVLGIDIDPLRIQKAQESIKGRTNIHFSCSNFMEIDLSGFNVILMIDVMHYFDFEFQDQVIKTIAQQLRPGAKFIFRTPDTKPLWRYYWNFAHESIMVGSSITKTTSSSIFFRASTALATILQSQGFELQIYPNRSIFPYSDTLFVCTKK